MTKYNSAFEAQFDSDRAQEFIVLQLLSRVHTATIVKVMSRTDNLLAVQPMVLDKDTSDVVIDPGQIFNVPYLRLQGGQSAIVLDPQPGDHGICLFAERDITNVIKTRAPGAPPTTRTFFPGDAMYLGGLLNGAPTQWVRFQPSGGIDVHAAGDLSLDAAGSITIKAAGAISIEAGGALDMTAAAINFNSPVVFKSTVNGTSAAAGAVAFAAPVSAPDFIAPAARLGSHIHDAPNGPTGGPHN